MSVVSEKKKLPFLPPSTTTRVESSISTARLRSLISAIQVSNQGHAPSPPRIRRVITCDLRPCRGFLEYREGVPWKCCEYRGLLITPRKSRNSSIKRGWWLYKNVCLFTCIYIYILMYIRMYVYMYLSYLRHLECRSGPWESRHEATWWNKKNPRRLNSKIQPALMCTLVLIRVYEVNYGYSNWTNLFTTLLREPEEIPPPPQPLRCPRDEQSHK